MKEDLGAVTAPGTIRFERLLSLDIDRAWAWLVEPELRAQWLAGGPMGTPDGDAFELLFDHTALSAEQAPERDVAAGWHAHLGVLLDVLDGRIPRPFWTRLDKAAAEYGKRITD